ncbi:MAG TPA: response regulator [Noviherbaspirillum sp.]
MAKILIIDDEERNRKLLEILMISDGHEVVSAINGQDGMRKVGAEMPDLIVLDVMMPGMDGFEVARSLKTNPQTKAIPILVASSLDDAASRKRMMAINIDAFLVKPIDRWELSRQVKELLYGREKVQQAQPARPSSVPE